MSETISYRLFQEQDLPSMLRLWKEAGWGALTEEQWRSWFIDTPQGPCLIVVAVNSAGEVVAQEVFTPSRICIGDRVVRALRFSAPILRKELRGESLRRGDHPVIELYKAAAKAAARLGFTIVYSLPEHGWLGVFRMSQRFGFPRFAEATYSCAKLRLDVTSQSPTNGATVARPVIEFSSEYDQLWASALKSFPISCGVVRDSAWLAFRNGGRIALEVRDARDGSLVGYTATNKQTGLLADVLARRPEDLTGVVAASHRWLAGNREHGAHGLTHLKVMKTAALEPTLAKLGFADEDFKFAFTCNTFDPSLGIEDIAPERWYLMPGD